MMVYRPDIDGLRALAVISVVVFHAFPGVLPGGFLGVDVFFVISGFLITGIVIKGLGSGEFKFSDFYSKRVRRIFPSLSLVLISVTIFGFFVLTPDELRALGKHVAAGSGFVSNIVLWNESGYFDVAAEFKPLLNLWSLGVEEQFYIIWPLLLFLAWRGVALNKALVVLLVTCFVLSLSLFLNLYFYKSEPVSAFFLPQFRLWEMLSGSLLAWFFLYFERRLSVVRLYGLSPISVVKNDKLIFELCNFSSFFGLSLVLGSVFFLSKDFSFPGFWATLPVAGAFLIIAGGSGAWINRHVLSSKLLVWFGLISYPLYLWHWPILSFGNILSDGEASSIYKISAVFISVVLSWLTLRFFENPIRYSVYKKITVLVLCIVMASIGALGIYIAFSDISKRNGYENLWFERKGFEHAIGTSLQWYEGKDGWLFLGNRHNRTVEKMRLSFEPSSAELEKFSSGFNVVSKAAFTKGAELVVFVGPNKSSVYPEYLPRGAYKSERRFIDFYKEALSRVPNVGVYDPLLDFYEVKDLSGLLYYRTDSHWNAKGAYIAYLGLMKYLDAPSVKVDFLAGKEFSGGIKKLADIPDYPVRGGDSWDPVVHGHGWEEKLIEDGKDGAFGRPYVSFAKYPLSDKVVWVVGDSFSGAVKMYLNETFKEVHYLGHWIDTFDKIPSLLNNSKVSPDIIIVERVERSF